MAEHNDINARTDTPAHPAGGRRRRTFLATPPQPKVEEAECIAAPQEDDDLPVLTEVVPPEAAVSEAGADRFDETLVSILASDVVHAIEQQLATELPTLIETALMNVRDELRSGINSSLDIALRNFLTRRNQLVLPLDEPNRH